MFSYFNLRRPSEFSKVNNSDNSSASGQSTPSFAPAPSPSPLTIPTVTSTGLTATPTRPVSFNESQLQSRPASGQFDVNQFSGFTPSGILPTLQEQSLPPVVNNQSDNNTGGGMNNVGIAGIRSVIFQNKNNLKKGKT